MNRPDLDAVSGLSTGLQETCELKPSEIASAALRLNQIRLDFCHTLRDTESAAVIGRAVDHTDREMRALACAVERLAVRLAQGKSKRSRNEASR